MFALHKRLFTIIAEHLLCNQSRLIKDGAISDTNLRLLVDEIKIYESDKKLRIEINLKAKFTKYCEIYGKTVWSIISYCKVKINWQTQDLNDFEIIIIA